MEQSQVVTPGTALDCEMKTLTVSNLQKSYYDKIVLNGLNFEVSKGEAISIIGSNGAGN